MIPHLWLNKRPHYRCASGVGFSRQANQHLLNKALSGRLSSCSAILSNTVSHLFFSPYKQNPNPSFAWFKWNYALHDAQVHTRLHFIRHIQTAPLYLMPVSHEFALFQPISSLTFALSVTTHIQWKHVHFPFMSSLMLVSVYVSVLSVALPRFPSLSVSHAWTHALWNAISPAHLLVVGSRRSTARLLLLLLLRRLTFLDHEVTPRLTLFIINFSKTTVFAQRPEPNKL